MTEWLRSYLDVLRCYKDECGGSVQIFGAVVKVCLLYQALTNKTGLETLDSI